MNSQFALRVAVLGAMALVAFTVIFFRLWYLEVLSGDEFLAEAQNNRVRELPIQAPRGEILDRNEKILVDNRAALSLQVRPDQLPKRLDERKRVIRRLSDAAGMPVKRINRQIREQQEELPASPVTLKRDVPQELVYFLAERPDQFPGISAEKVSVREYPNGNLAAHLFGYVSEINEEQLTQPQYAELKAGDRIGAAGVEAQYDNVLRGRNGAIRVTVDAAGQPRGRPISNVEPEPGNNLVLTVDKKIQEAGEQAVGQFGVPAAFVAMNLNDGAVLGMGSFPTFDPSIYTPPVSFNQIEGLLEADGDPLFNKAIQSAYPTGSTFKMVTSVAGLEEEMITPGEIVSDGGSFEFAGRKWINAGEQPNGPIDMAKALQVSSDVYYYKLGIDADARQERSDGKDNPFEKWASQFGFGSLTGIDLPGEGAGFVPTPDWRDGLYEQALEPDSPGGTEAVFPEETDRPWSVGDMMNLSVGQGDLLATPLQLAVSYAAMGNGGKIVRPHVAQAVQNPLGQTEQEFTPGARREIDISPGTRSVVMEGLRRAAMEPGGTSAGIFGPSFPFEIAGKTGTAETPVDGVLQDQSWYAAVVPFDDPQIVVAVTVECNCFGSEAAAPAAKQIITEYGRRYMKVSDKRFQEAAEAAAERTPASD